MSTGHVYVIFSYAWQPLEVPLILYPLGDGEVGDWLGVMPALRARADTWEPRDNILESEAFQSLRKSGCEIPLFWWNLI